MAKSLDQLIDFLLEKIALFADHGLTLREIVGYVNAFYSQPQDSLATSSSTTQIDAFLVNRQFISKIWQWLTREEDVLVSGNEDYKSFTFEQLEQSFPGIAGHLLDAPNGHDQALSSLAYPVSLQEASDAPRISVTTERIYYAICGHDPDPTRVPAAEFALLSVIARGGHDGILQGEAGRIAEQDKRSVPKRTDALATKGYIVKRTVYTGGHKTSRLILRRFAEAASSIVHDGTPAYPLRELALQAYVELKKNKFTTQDDLASALITTDPVRKRVLSQVITQLVRRKCLKKVKAAVGPASTSSELKVCLQVVREPIETDWVAQADDIIDFESPVETAVTAARQHIDDANQASDEIADGIADAQAEEDEDIGNAHEVSQWNPDRQLPNVLHDLASNAGERGITNMLARQLITGLPVRRPIEACLTRLSHASMTTQPLEIRRLALTRTLEVENSISRFVHRTFDTYRSMVQKGSMRWSDLTGGQLIEEGLKQYSDTVPTASIEQDEYGFIPKAKLQGQIHNGPADLEAVVNLVGATSLTVRAREAILLENVKGETILSSNALNGNTRANGSRATPIRPKTSRTLEGPLKAKLPEVPRHGRPRKFVQGTERYWRDMFVAKKLEDEPQHTNLNDLKVGITRDAACLEWYKIRPVGFDETILQAIKHKLPLPATCKDISTDWVDRTKAFLNRKGSGAFATPAGSTKALRGNPCCLLVVRSQRLHEVDRRGRTLASPPVLFLTSSAAHTFRYLPRDTRTSIEGKRQNKKKATTNSVQPRTQSPATAGHAKKAARGPNRGSFHELSLHSVSPSTTLTQTPVPGTRVAKRKRTGDGKRSQTIDKDSEVTNSDLEASKRKVARAINSNRTPSLQVILKYKKQALPKSDLSSNAAKTSVNHQGRQISTSVLQSQSLPMPDAPPTMNEEVQDEKVYTESQHQNPLADITAVELVKNQPDSNDHPHPVTLVVVNGSKPSSAPSTTVGPSNIQMTTSALVVPTNVLEPPNDVDHAIVAEENRRSKAYSEVVSGPLNTDGNPRTEMTASRSNVSNTATAHITKAMEASPIVENHYPWDGHGNHQNLSIEQPSLNGTTGLQISGTAVPEILTLDRATIQGLSTNHQTGEFHTGAEESLSMVNGIGSSTPDVANYASSDDSAPAADSEVPFSDDTPKPKFLKGRDALEYYKKFIMELIFMCGGVVPHSPSTLKRALKPKCIEANIEVNIHIKLLQSQLKILIARGKLKVMKFVFQKNGFNHTKSILALGNITAIDGRFLDLRQKIISLPIEDEYIPPELEAEEMRKPSGVFRRDPLQDSVKKASAPPPVPKGKVGSIFRRRSPSTATESVELASPPASRRRTSTMIRLDQQGSTSPSPPLVETPNTGFLTLKVPRIAQVATSSSFTSHYFALPDEPAIRFNADANAGVAEIANTLPTPQRRSSIRHRRTIYEPGQRKLQWRVPKKTALPKSLQAILSQDRRDARLEVELEANPPLAAFDRAVDFVATWEQRNWDDLQEPKVGEWNFINHFVVKKEFAYILQDQELQFRALRFAQDPEDFSTSYEIETDLPEAESWDVFQAVLDEARKKQKKADVAAENRKRQLEQFDESDFAESENEAAKPKRARRTMTTSTSKPSRKRKTVGTANDQRRKAVSGIRPRGIGMRHLPKDMALKVTLAFVVVKVLTGGLDKHLDFRLASRMIPSESEAILKERWKVLSTQYHNEVNAYVQDMQIKYLDALADDLVPSVNFDDIDGSDWEKILEWAVQNLSTEVKSVELELAPSREEFLTLNKVEISEPKPMRNLFNQSLKYTMISNEEAWCSVVMATSPSTLPVLEGDQLEPVFQSEDAEADTDRARARSWVLSAVLTRQQNYNAARTHEKLLKLSADEQAREKLLAATMKMMQADKIIVRQDNGDAVTEIDGSTYSGTHGWKISSRWFDKFESNRNIASSMLQEAARYKLEVLDSIFARGESLNLEKNPNLSDGTMVAIFNLFNMGMLHIKPGADVPASRYGLDWEDQGYKTRSMDRDVLSFSTNLEPTREYVQGFPISSPERSIPRGQMDQVDELGLIPAWFDINLGFQPHIWEMILGAIIGIISVRPGVSTLEIVRTLNWALTERDVAMVIHFLLDCDLIKKTCTGWDTMEWWWLATGAGTGTEHGIQWKV